MAETAETDILKRLDSQTVTGQIPDSDLDLELKTQRVAQAHIVGKATGIGADNVFKIKEELVREGIPADLVDNAVEQKAASARPKGVA